MAEEFKAITTQEELNAVIGERLKRVRESTEKRLNDKYAGYISQAQQEANQKELQDKLDAATAKAKADAETISGLNSKVKKYETDSVKSRIAEEFGIPHTLASRLQGDDEKALRADAETLKNALGGSRAPAASSEPVASGDATKAAYKQMLNALRNKE